MLIIRASVLLLNEHRSLLKSQLNQTKLISPRDSKSKPKFAKPEEQSMVQQENVAKD